MDLLPLVLCLATLGNPQWPDQVLVDVATEAMEVSLACLLRVTAKCKVEVGACLAALGAMAVVIRCKATTELLRAQAAMLPVANKEVTPGTKVECRHPTMHLTVLHAQLRLLFTPLFRLHYILVAAG